MEGITEGQENHEAGSWGHLKSLSGILFSQDIRVMQRNENHPSYKRAWKYLQDSDLLAKSPREILSYSLALFALISDFAIVNCCVYL